LQILGLLSTLFFSIFAAAQTPTLSVEVNQIKGKVSPMLYGLMTEEINYSYDGGLYAELVRNRAFTDNRRLQPFHWVLYEAGHADASMIMDMNTGPSAALPLSLAVTIRSATNNEQAGVANLGYWGIPVKPDTIYQGSFDAKAGDPSIGPITVRIINEDTAKVLASTTVAAISSEWKQYTFSLRSSAATPMANNRLVLSVGKPGKLWFSLVSLFPPTYKNRANGNRADIMEMLAAMRPMFLRFPGGNYLEGDHVADRFPWQKMIGPLVDRPTHPSPWNYLSSDGMGLLEFLEWCEDLNMEPVLGVYAGYSLRQDFVKPGPDLEPFIAEALDEIEYVTGSVDTKWGSERAKNGHPAPFKLTYVEIGNEDNHDRSGTYDGRFAQFFKAIKAKYPDLKQTVGWWADPKSSNSSYSSGNYNWSNFSSGKKIADIVDFYSIHLYGLTSDTFGIRLNPGLKTKVFVSEVENGLQTKKSILIEEFGEANGDAVSDQDTIGSPQSQAIAYQGVYEALKEMHSSQLIGSVAFDFYSREQYPDAWAIVKSDGNYLFPAAYILQEYALGKSNPSLRTATVVTSQSYLLTNADNHTTKNLHVFDRIGLKLQLDTNKNYSPSLSGNDILQSTESFHYDARSDSYYAIYQATSKGSVQLNIHSDSACSKDTICTSSLYVLNINIQ